MVASIITDGDGNLLDDFEDMIKAKIINNYQ